jgi:hypothetical protein
MPWHWSISGWHRFWAIWFSTSVGVFLTAEIYGLVTDPRRTLSEAIWSWEKFKPNQGIDHWTAFHFLFIALLLVLDVWLLGHFGWGRWR